MVSLCASAAGWVQMRCRECAAEVAVTARVCSRCEAPILGQPPVVADTVVGHGHSGRRGERRRSQRRRGEGCSYWGGPGGEVATGARRCGGGAHLGARSVGASAEEARLVGWAEWAASTTFSSTGLTSGYDKQEVGRLSVAPFAIRSSG